MGAAPDKNGADKWPAPIFRRGGAPGAKIRPGEVQTALADDPRLNIEDGGVSLPRGADRIFDPRLIAIP